MRRYAFVAAVALLLPLGAMTYAHAGHAIKCVPNCHDGVTINGSSFNDKIVGGKEHDHLYGHAGNDRFWLGRDSDWVWGGTGDDLIRAWAPTEHAQPQTDYVNCGPGVDTVITGATDHDVLTDCEIVLVH